MTSQADHARKARTSFNGTIPGTRGAPPIRPGVSAGSGSNATRNRKALKEQDLSELQTGQPQSYWDAVHEAMRASVRQRFGKRAA